ncbi:cobalamin-binding protein [Marinobacterium arenosum]|uniref:cobalamin-binding protein n=1 Tax=Marinobacterium arenosum TaxID=2862496 RepID=UPI001C961119|nr:cobalamin-binding protein [Marinobacterium arenosum]MBY4678597.1 cobalamin-binding protein [Marinobacterium arenosum]
MLGLVLGLLALPAAAIAQQQPPVQRIVSLAPHITENLFSIGAGDRVVGVVTYSDYPPEVQQLPLVGSYQLLNLEAILALKPDLVVAWRQGSPAAQLVRLESLGIRVLRVDGESFENIADNLRLYGRLTGLEARANRVADRFQAELQTLRQQYAGRPRVKVFFQVWHQPLMTINRSQLIHRMLELCAADNPFAERPEAIPRLSVEAVIAAAPEVIVTSLENPDDHSWIDFWRRWSMIPAVRRQAFVTLDSDLTHRATLRALQGAQQLCRTLDGYR